jgi:hypothetical protein
MVRRNGEWNVIDYSAEHAQGPRTLSMPYVNHATPLSETMGRFV